MYKIRAMEETEPKPKRTRGHPPRAGERSRARVVVACTYPELESWHRVAAARGVKLAELVRTLLDIALAKDTRHDKA